MRRGAGGAGGVAVTGAAGRGGTTVAANGAAGCAATGGRLDGGATVTAGRAGGAIRAAVSACLRSRIAFSASPGLDTCDRSNFGLASTGATRGAVVRAPRLK